LTFSFVIRKELNWQNDEARREEWRFDLQHRELSFIFSRSELGFTLPSTQQVSGISFLGVRYLGYTSTDEDKNV